MSRREMARPTCRSRCRRRTGHLAVREVAPVRPDAPGGQLGQLSEVRAPGRLRSMVCVARGAPHTGQSGLAGGR
jgi:hypothetical protein